MEAAGLAIGVPGALEVLLRTGVSGYEAITRVRNADGDFNDHTRGIRVEHLAFLDWKKRTQPVMASFNTLSPENQERMRLIIATLLQIVSVFNELAELHDDLTFQETKKSPKKTTRSPFRVSIRWKRGSKSTPSTSPCPAVIFQPAQVAEEIKRGMGLDKLEPLAKEMQRSVSTLSAFRWALLDRKKAEELYLRLKKYNKDLRRISEPLIGTSDSNITASAQFFLVPIPRNPNFVVRGDTFCNLDGLLQSNDGRQTRAALWGLGGTGKTSMAVEYCHFVRDRFPMKAINIFWIHGNTDAAFKASYQEIAKAANISTTGMDDEKDLNNVKQWLEGTNSGNWLMVIDNVDDLSLDPRYIPMTNGRILFTSRDGRILGHPDFGVSASDGVELQSMTRPEAEALLQNSIGVSSGIEPSDELCELLGDLPLAITQAAAYIRKSHSSIADYLKLYRKSADLQAKLLEKPISSHSANESNLRTVMTTWTVTMKKIADENPVAIDVLRFMSLLDPEQIPLKVLRSSRRFRHMDELDFAESICILLNFALLTQLDTDHYRLHRLVSFFTVRSMHEQKSGLVEEVMSTILKSIPKQPLAEMPKCLPLVPHALAVLQHMEQENTNSTTALSLQTRIGDIMRHNAQYDTALKLYQRALDGREKTLRKGHPNTLRIVHNMAIIFELQQRYNLALKWYKRALDGYENAFGKEHFTTLKTVCNIALIFTFQDQYDVALGWYRRALESQEKSLGKDHVDTLVTVQGMGLLFLGQGQFEIAMEWYRRALEGQEKALGKDHPATLGTIHNMAQILTYQGQHELASEWYRRVLDGREKAFGKDHPLTIGTSNTLKKCLERLDQQSAR